MGKDICRRRKTSLLPQGQRHLSFSKSVAPGISEGHGENVHKKNVGSEEYLLFHGAIGNKPAVVKETKEEGAKRAAQKGKMVSERGNDRPEEATECITSSRDKQNGPVKMTHHGKEMR